MAKATDTQAIALTRVLSDNIRTLQDRHELSNRALADRAGLGTTYITVLHSAARDGTGRVPTVDNLMAIADAFGCDIKVLLKPDGPTRPTLNDVVVAAVNAVETVANRLRLELTAEQRAAVVARMVVGLSELDEWPADLPRYAEHRAEIVLDMARHVSP